MADGTRLKEIQESINQLKVAMVRLEERTAISGKCNADIQQQINMLASAFGDINSATPHRATSTTHSDIGGIHSRSVRLDFPTYDGEEDPTNWLFRVEQFFLYHQTSPAQRLLIVSFHLRRPALHWYKLLESDHAITSWEAFSKALILRFGPTEYEDLAISLTKLHQQTTVSAYQKHFEALATKVAGLSENLLTAKFISGLKDELRYDVQIFKPTTFSATVGLARLLEEKYQTCRKNRVEYVRPSPPTHHSLTLPIKRLSTAEMRESREKGLCYNCDEKFSPGYKCKTQKLFLLDVQLPLYKEEQEAVVILEEPELHAR
ncbi:Retrotransposon gag domain-containing protein [Dioscorea alata]|uniref:Retrotransposon gag domain-containing protein n=1 Tax=Dioscorea alata TaxID=55571 RepID=A0ACB7V9L5_DIOAL|nr:Retrotransposon gag domain-containing protein [Dioscorea alata]